MELYLYSSVKKKRSTNCPAAALQPEFSLSALELQSVNYAAYEAALNGILVRIPGLLNGIVAVNDDGEYYLTDVEQERIILQCVLPFPTTKTACR